MSSVPYPNRRPFFISNMSRCAATSMGILLALFLGTFGVHHFICGGRGWGFLLHLLLDGDHGNPRVCRVLFMPGGARVQRDPGAGIARRWDHDAGVGQPLNVTVNMPPGGQPGAQMRADGASRPIRRGAFCSAAGNAGVGYFENLARRLRARGGQLDYAEAVALLSRTPTRDSAGDWNIQHHDSGSADLRGGRSFSVMAVLSWRRAALRLCRGAVGDAANSMTRCCLPSSPRVRVTGGEHAKLTTNLLDVDG